jgi:hypothetical protein
MFSEMLLNQVKPYLAGKPEVWAKEFGEPVTFSSTLGAVAKAKFLPFGKNKMPTDCRVFHQLPTQTGEVIAVLNFSAFAVQPTDFLFIHNRNIPRAAFLKKARGMELTDKWATALTENKAQDPFAEYLTKLERKKGLLPESPHTYANWVYHLGKLAIEVPYTMALMPLGDGRTIFLFKKHYRPGFFSVKKSDFDVELVWRIAEWIDEALAEFNYQGDPAPLEVPVPAVSLLAIPEIAPMFEYQGRDIPFEIDLSGFAPASNTIPAGSPAGSMKEPAQEHKFCIQCGESLPTNAVFCSKCGTKQG